MTEAGSAARGDLLRYLGAGLILFVGGVHLQQYLSFIEDVPTVGVLFILNAAGAAGIALGLAGTRDALPAVAGIALCVGALVSVAIALYATLFGYTETWRVSTVLAVAAELLAVAVLAGFIAARRRASLRGSTGLTANA